MDSTKLSWQIKSILRPRSHSFWYTPRQKSHEEIGQMKTNYCCLLNKRTCGRHRRWHYSLGLFIEEFHGVQDLRRLWRYCNSILKIRGGPSLRFIVFFFFRYTSLKEVGPPSFEFVKGSLEYVEPVSFLIPYFPLSLF